MKGEKREGNEGDQEVLEFTIIYLSRLDGWIIDVLMCVMSEDTRGSQKKITCTSPHNFGINERGSVRGFQI